MRRAERQAVVDRARNLCEYCRSPADYSLAAFEVEHILPSVSGGTDDLDNLAWSCPHCNSHKAAAVEAADPDSPEQNELVPLFHPRRDSWNEHFIWSSDSLTIVGTTATGRATVVRLGMNRQEAVNLRHLLAGVGLHPPD